MSEWGEAGPEREALENLFRLWDSGDSEGAWGHRSRAGLFSGSACLPVQQPRLLAVSVGAHVVRPAHMGHCRADSNPGGENGFPRHVLVVYCVYIVRSLIIEVDYRGTFLLERPDRSSFEVRVPPFSLESQDER